MTTIFEKGKEIYEEWKKQGGLIEPNIKGAMFIILYLESQIDELKDIVAFLEIEAQPNE